MPMLNFTIIVGDLLKMTKLSSSWQHFYEGKKLLKSFTMSKTITEIFGGEAGCL